jgi:hypothetical protein
MVVVAQEVRDLLLRYRLLKQSEVVVPAVAGPLVLLTVKELKDLMVIVMALLFLVPPLHLEPREDLVVVLPARPPVVMPQVVEELRGMDHHIPQVVMVLHGLS